jgi:TPR repeat protein
MHLERSARKRNVDAQYLLGHMYANGIRVSKDVVEGYVWLKLAASQGHEGAEYLLECLAKEMTPDQIAKAETGGKPTMDVGKIIDQMVYGNVQSEVLKWGCDPDIYGEDEYEEVYPFVAKLFEPPIHIARVLDASNEITEYLKEVIEIGIADDPVEPLFEFFGVGQVP